jgi:hypothetical protein
MLLIMVDFDPAIMNPASIILPTIETITNTENTTHYIDIIIIAIFILLIIMIYLRITNKI